MAGPISLGEVAERLSMLDVACRQRERRARYHTSGST
jgi:hypothetical protein